MTEAQYYIKRILLGVILTFLLLGDATGQWLPGYSHRNKMEIRASNVSGSQDLLDFPLLVHMVGPELRTAAYGGELLNPLGKDIRFTLEDGTLLDFDIEFFSISTGNMAVWIRMPLLSYTENSIIYAYYGNASINSLPPVSNVWTSDYRGVWHMSSNTDDASQYANHGTDKGTSSMDGKIGLSRGFDGVVAKVGVYYDSSLGIQDNLSMETWLRYTDDDDLYNGLITKQGDYELWYAKDHIMFIVADGSMEYPIELEEDNWYHICATYDRSFQRLFVNGTEVSSLANTTQISNDITEMVGIGFHDGTETSELSGDLDEVRISSRTLSPDWIRTSYRNQNNPAAFSVYIETEISNDIPCEATLINLNDDCSTNIYSTLSATYSGIPLTPCNTSSQADTWFKVAVPASGNINVRLESGPTTEIPSQTDWLMRPGLAIYHGTCDNLTYDTCWVHALAGPPFQIPEMVLSGYTPGDSIFIKIWSSDLSVGKFRICALGNEELPTITCPDNIEHPNDDNLCSAALTVPVPQASSENGIATLLNDFNGTSDASDTYPVGISLVQWTVTDSFGNQAVCSHSITVFDTLQPAIICPVNREVYLNDECEYVIPDFSDSAIVTDLCDPAPVVTQSPLAGTVISGAGTSQLITIIARDSSDNQSQCEFSVVLRDTIRPTFTSLENQTEYIDVNCQFALPDYTSLLIFNDNCDPAPVTSQDPPAGAILLGTDSLQSVSISIEDNGGNIAVCEFSLILRDTIRPTFTSLENQTEYIDVNCQFALPDYTSLLIFNDNCDPAPVTSQDPPAGTLLTGTDSLHPVSISIEDKGGNIAVCEFSVDLHDAIGPVFNCPESVSEDLIDNCDFLLPDYGSTVGLLDNCDLSLSITQSPPVGSLLSGSGTSQEVVLTAVDLSENQSVCSFQLTLVDQSPPIVTKLSDTVVFIEEGNYESVVSLPLPGFEDNCGIASIVNSQNGDGDASGTYPYGSTMVEYTVSDINGNVAIFTQEVEVRFENEPDNGLIIPEAFSPNEDGLNDRFEILGLERYTKVELQVFNVHGIKVYHNENYDNSWDGVSQGYLSNGSKKLPTGTYFYILNLDPEGKLVKGFVFLRRE